MFSRSLLLSALFLVLAAVIFDSHVEARYLPTRSNGDRIDKLRELLKEVSKMYRLLENEIEKEEMSDVPRWHPDSKLFYKREAKEATPVLSPAPSEQ
ncbi:hypothetical protein NQ315_010943 [Exocentrus adspersus]|uniref:Uncharacterized protein n=1 Tax=Exocentrus adspersus TaxID=1586481 RepID=A0AAV8VPW3_9CUCU|nr:hypothetical protein NQ315_010943 [Exocentrus adspersus]